jgi:hypothetical protein
MINTTRRSFLFGLGAIIAIAKTKIIEPVTQIPYDELDIYAKYDRTYFDINIGKTKYLNDAKATFVDIFSSESKVLNLATHPNGYIHWRAIPDESIFIPDYSYLRIDASGDTRDLQIDLIYANEDEQMYDEKHSFDELGNRLQLVRIPLMAQSV